MAPSTKSPIKARRVLRSTSCLSQSGMGIENTMRSKNIFDPAWARKVDTKVYVLCEPNPYRVAASVARATSQKA